MREYICIGLLAHVDAGKTTLSEALLHRTGAIRSAGRVDHGDAFLDTDSMERDRGITIFSAGGPRRRLSGYGFHGEGPRHHDFFQAGLVHDEACNISASGVREKSRKSRNRWNSRKTGY